MSTPRKTQSGYSIVAVFETPQHAQAAVQALREANFSTKQLGVATPDEASTRQLMETTVVPLAKHPVVQALVNRQTDKLAQLLAASGSTEPRKDATQAEETFHGGGAIVMVESGTRSLDVRGVLGGLEGGPSTVVGLAGDPGTLIEDGIRPLKKKSKSSKYGTRKRN